MAERAAVLLGRSIEELRLVTLQLGSGASACAIAGGHSVDTSMGMTPAEGLVMATRSGDVDPLMLQYLARMGAGTPDELWTALERGSGLVGLTGEKEMKAVIDRAAAGDHDADLAVALVCLRIRKYVAAYLAVLGGADAVVFGGGVGEHSPVVRALSLSHFQWAGIELDESANRASVGQEAVISTAASRVAVLVTPVDEESMICRDVVAER
jgi:acetate kinase